MTVGFYHATQLVNHYQAKHGLDIKIEEREFPNMKKFFLWKEQEEASSCSSFVQPNGEVAMQGKTKAPFSNNYFNSVRY